MPSEEEMQRVDKLSPEQGVLLAKLKAEIARAYPALTAPPADAREDGELCSRCGKHYSTVYRVPAHLWATLTSDGGLLCPACCDRAAAEQGIPLYWEAAVSRYPTDSPADVLTPTDDLARRLAVELEREALLGPHQVPCICSRCRMLAEARRVGLLRDTAGEG